MSGQLAGKDDPATCWDCGAKHGGGKPFHKFTSDINGVIHFEYRCEPCIDWVSRAMWPEEDWGPYPEMPIPEPTGRPSRWTKTCCH